MLLLLGACAGSDLLFRDVAQTSHSLPPELSKDLSGADVHGDILWLVDDGGTIGAVRSSDPGETVGVWGGLGDTEGIAVDGQDVYVVEERARRLLRVSTDTDELET